MPYAKKRVGRAVRRTGARAYKKVIHPYVSKKKGYNNRMKLYKEVSAIKKMLNAEKKEIRTYISNTTTALGQINVNTNNAYWQQDITPIIPQGVSDGQRNGDSVKLVSLQIKGQFIQQSSAVLPVKVRVYIVQVNGTPEGVDIGNFLVQNPITGCYDWNSIRNKDRFKNYTVLMTKSFRIASDQYSGQGGTFKDFRIGLKFPNRHLNYLSATNVISNGQILMYMVTDSGNIGATNSTNTVIPVIHSSTGLNLRYTCDAWYYDN